MDGIEVFRKLRDVCNEIVTAYDTGNESDLENAMGKFMVLAVQLDAIK